MKHICILVPENSVMQAIADPQYLFSAVNQFLTQSGHGPRFKIDLVGMSKEVSINQGAFTISTTKQVDEIAKADLIIIPALFGDLKMAIASNAKFLPWIRKQYAQGAEIASLCLGAFLLASTGLLNGKKCSTHWGFQNEFRAMFPDVTLVDGKIVTEEGRLYSSGGALSYWNLLLYLVEKYTNRQTAILAAKYFGVDIDRNSQSAFAMFQGQRSHTDEGIKTVQDFIERNVGDRMSIEDLAEMIAVGRRTFERRFKAATHNSVLEYINRVKMEAAKRHFESSRKNMNEVMFDIGYTDTKAFRTAFKKVTGLTPVAYRNKYYKMESV